MRFLTFWTPQSFFEILSPKNAKKGKKLLIFHILHKTKNEHFLRLFCMFFGDKISKNDRKTQKKLQISFFYPNNHKKHHNEYAVG